MRLGCCDEMTPLLQSRRDTNFFSFFWFRSEIMLLLCSAQLSRRVAHLRTIVCSSKAASSQAVAPASMPGIEVFQFPARSDNYGYLVHDVATGATACVDTPAEAATDAALQLKGWKLTHILNTHHHEDHTGGNLYLKKKHGCTVVGPAADAARIPGIDVQASDGDTLSLGATPYVFIHTPGHTRGHGAFFFPTEHAAFVGDTLFSMGCGRLFEGTPEQMLRSVGALAALPDDTLLYCAHEYTASNARFALSVEPGNDALVERAKEVDALRMAGKPTVPTTLKLEKATNPFLRTGSPEIRAKLGFDENAKDVDVFAETRRRKDKF